ncbi:MAG: M28 family peptidase [Candidatus Acidiferrales bacterium]
MRLTRCSVWIAASICAAFLSTACGHESAKPGSSPSGAVTSAAWPTKPPRAQAETAPPASETGGFDGSKAFAHVSQLVAIGPHPPASEGIRRAQDYIRAQLQGYGCTVEEQDFHASTPVGNLAMKNIIAKIPGTGQGIILLLTHYDTLRMDNFVGAEDSGSSTALMLEMARLLCGKQHGPNAVWISFLDGEEAQVHWSETDSVYGSRELAARLAISGEIKRVKAVILADMIGQYDLQILRETNSTKWLVDLIWKAAARLGYKNIFVDRDLAVDDDHQPFLRRGVAAVDIIDLEGYQQIGYWHTTADTLDKVSPRSMAIVGHVILESVAELQRKFH